MSVLLVRAYSRKRNRKYKERKGESEKNIYSYVVDLSWIGGGRESRGEAGRKRKERERKRK